mmetsp:Transcript_9911/g.21589  ORF Transcript_9911/g.21589 Transcript_9911/m.21589 type:complete len:136 (+) Transcript_9911:2066-2473(+)
MYHGGLYHPYTADGTIVVGGILASTFLATRTALILFWLELTLIFHGAPLSIYNCATYGGVMLGKYLATEEANPPVQLLKIGLTAVTLALIAVASVVTSLLDSLVSCLLSWCGVCHNASLRIVRCHEHGPCRPHVW